MRGSGGQGQAGGVLVVGCGFIGANVVEELRASGRPLTVLTRSQPPAEVADLIAEEDLVVGDARDRALLERALRGIDHVVYSAGGLLPVASEREPERDEQLTLEPLRAVLAALAEQPQTSLLYLSSGGTVYGEPDRVPVGEDAPTDPIGAYGRIHLTAESEVLEQSHAHGTPVRILRCSTVYGKHQRPGRGQGVVTTFLQQIAAGEEICIYGDGETIRDYIYAGDVARAIVELLDRPGGAEILNLASGVPTSLNEVLRLTEEEVGRPAAVVRRSARDFEVHRIVLDTSRLRSLIEFEPTPLKTGIARTHAWLASGGEG